MLPREPLGGSPSLGRKQFRWSECSSWHSNQMEVSRESGHSGGLEEVLGWKLICPPLRIKRPKTQWPNAHGDEMCLCFTTPVGNDCHLLPYVFRSLQGFPGDLASSSGEDTTPGYVLWMLDEHYGVMMNLDALSKELYSLKQGMGENVASLECGDLKKFRYSRWIIPTESNRSMWRRWSGITSTKALVLSTSGC